MAWKWWEDLKQDLKQQWGFDETEEPEVEEKPRGIGLVDDPVDFDAALDAQIALYRKYGISCVDLEQFRGKADHLLAQEVVFIAKDKYIGIAGTTLSIEQRITLAEDGIKNAARRNSRRFEMQQGSTFYLGGGTAVRIQTQVDQTAVTETLTQRLGRDIRSFIPTDLDEVLDAYFLVLQKRGGGLDVVTQKEHVEGAERYGLPIYQSQIAHCKESPTRIPELGKLLQPHVDTWVQQVYDAAVATGDTTTIVHAVHFAALMPTSNRAYTRIRDNEHNQEAYGNLEFDASAEPAILALAQQYLRMGEAVEAERVLGPRILTRESRNPNVYRTMAAIQMQTRFAGATKDRTKFAQYLNAVADELERYMIP